MSWRFGARSERLLELLHPDLVLVLREALRNSPTDFGIGPTSVRTPEQQARMMEEGRSLTANSRHIPAIPLRTFSDLTGGPIDKRPVSHAADLLLYRSGKLCWDDDFVRDPTHGFPGVAAAIEAAAEQAGVKIEWGGHWRSLVDMPHFQLPWDDYPVAGDTHV